MENPILSIQNLTYIYPNGREALTDINIDIQKNEFLAIIGQNGAGKSTLMKNITGLIRPTKGRILMNGNDMIDTPVAEISKKIGFVLQNPDRQLFCNTVEEEVAYGLKNAGMDEGEIKNLVDEALNAVGLLDKKEIYPPALSKGDRAKTVIASVIAMRPEIIILDEPTNGQDNRGCYQIMDIARKLHEMGHTIIFVTHSMPLVADYAKRAIVMIKKKIMMDDTPEQVFARPDELEATHISPPQVAQLSNLLIREKIPLKKLYLRAEDMADALIELKRRG